VSAVNWVKSPFNEPASHWIGLWLIARFTGLQIAFVAP